MGEMEWISPGGRTVVCGERGDYACSAEEGEIQSVH